MRTRFSPVLGLVLAVLVATPATAQIGGLIKKAKKSAEEAVTPFNLAPAPEFDAEVLEITQERYLQLETGLRAEIAAARTAEKDLAAFELEREKNAAAELEAQKKHDAEVAAWEAKRASQQKLVDEYDRKVEDHTKCMDAIEEANDKDAAQAEKLLEEGKVMEANALAQRILKRVESCGPIPREPKLDPMPESPRTRQVQGPSNTYEYIRQKGEQAGGFKPRPYAIMRERWLNYCQTDGKPSMGFSQEEFAVLQANKKACGGLVKSLSQANIL
jgi:hypothetical protein